MEKIRINKDGVEIEASVIENFQSDKGYEYLIYNFDDEEVHVSRVMRNETEIQLLDIPEEDEAFVNDTMKKILEEE